MSKLTIKNACRIEVTGRVPFSYELLPGHLRYRYIYILIVNGENGAIRGNGTT